MRYTSAIFTIPTLFAALASAFPTALRAQPPVASTEPLLEMKESVEQRLKPSSGQVAVARSEDAAAPSLTVTIQPGADDYPGIMLEPPMPWDLLAFGHVESRITNLAMAAPAAAAPAS